VIEQRSSCVRKEALRRRGAARRRRGGGPVQLRSRSGGTGRQSHAWHSTSSCSMSFQLPR
jgi:hypothetical protein